VKSAFRAETLREKREEKIVSRKGAKTQRKEDAGKPVQIFFSGVSREYIPVILPGIYSRHGICLRLRAESG
jgi:hypothetical protein